MALIGDEFDDEKLILSIDCSIVSCRASKGKNDDGVFMALLSGEETFALWRVKCEAGGR